jgi:hypothetical protein
VRARSQCNYLQERQGTVSTFGWESRKEDGALVQVESLAPLVSCNSSYPIADQHRCAPPPRILVNCDQVGAKMSKRISSQCHVSAMLARMYGRGRPNPWQQSLSLLVSGRANAAADLVLPPTTHLSAGLTRKAAFDSERLGAESLRTTRSDLKQQEVAH